MWMNALPCAMKRRNDQWTRQHELVVSQSLDECLACFYEEIDKISKWPRQGSENWMTNILTMQTFQRNDCPHYHFHL